MTQQVLQQSTQGQSLHGSEADTLTVDSASKDTADHRSTEGADNDHDISINDYDEVQRIFTAGDRRTTCHGCDMEQGKLLCKILWKVLDLRAHIQARFKALLCMKCFNTVAMRQRQILDDYREEEKQQYVKQLNQYRDSQLPPT